MNMRRVFTLLLPGLLLSLAFSACGNGETPATEPEPESSVSVSSSSDSSSAASSREEPPRVSESEPESSEKVISSSETISSSAPEPPPSSAAAPTASSAPAETWTFLPVEGFDEVGRYEIKQVTTAEVEALPANLTYYEIAQRLGKTRDIGMNNNYRVLAYIADGRMILFNVSDKTEVCALSGKELLAASVPVAPEEKPGKGRFYGIVLSKSDYNGHLGSLLYVPGNRDFDLASAGLDKETIFFADGAQAAFVDIPLFGAVMVSFSGEVQESYPVGLRADKIVILQ